MEQSERPVILLGSSIRLSVCEEIFLRIAELLQAPIVIAWNPYDLIPDACSLYAGRSGTLGTWPGNLRNKNTEFLLALSSHLKIRQISYKWNSFARGVYIAWVELDATELRKPTVRADLAIHAGLAQFLPKLQKMLNVRPIKPHNSWLAWCRARLERYMIPVDELTEDSSTQTQA